MIFNSVQFILFFGVVYILYWVVGCKNRVYQNALLLFSSWIFYSCWDYRFLFLLFFSTCLDYFSGHMIHNAKNFGLKKFWLVASLMINIGFLCFFKYFNFFVNSMSKFLHVFGLETNVELLNIILPVGISFYTFHGVSYIVDIYKGRIKAEKNFIDYSLFVSYFPLLVAGPIERATHLLPQLKVRRVFSYEKSVDGLRLILWGLVKKVIIADQCAHYVDLIYGGDNLLNGSTWLVGSVLFAFQIYGDFSGYTDMALGISKLLGIDLITNFSFPYFSKNISEFWARWHISLSSWFRDYLYIPLGGNRKGLIKTLRNTFVVFLVSGFWHGANWTFILWGLYHAVLITPLVLFFKDFEWKFDNHLFHKAFSTISILTTFFLVVIGWVLFRSININQSFVIYSSIFSKTFFQKPSVLPIELFLTLILFILIEWLAKDEDNVLRYFLRIKNVPARWLIYMFLCTLIFYYSGSKNEFIYFQF
jgi:alginate O-acetyltransferase complex protein AlgI